MRACDGQELKRMIAAGTRWLEKNAETVNALNVFPVPDGDTGTNMLLTMRAAMREIEDNPDHSASAVAQGAAHGALMGARGNSGVILSQLLRGFAQALEGKESFDGHDFAVAMQEGSDVAYQGVIKPVEGTILTVAREAASAAKEASDKSDNLLIIVGETVRAADDAVEKTIHQLDVLKKAGVVDAGGKGLYCVLEGALRYLRGEDVEQVASFRAPSPSGPSAEREEVLASIGDREMQYGYCTQFIIQGEGLNPDAVRRHLLDLGDSALVVGDSDLIRVHVHTFQPGEVLSYAGEQGILRDIKIDNMQEQHEHFIGMTAQAEEQPGAEVVPSTPSQTEDLVGMAVVAVAQGEGLQEVFRRLGVSAIVPGGQTMNPSTEELHRAIENVTTDKVIVLPNNPNVIMAARQAQNLSEKAVIVVPTRTVPEGIAAVLALNYQADLEENTQAMERAIAGIETAQITRAVRDARVDDLEIEEDDVIGLLNGKLTTRGHDIEDVALALLSQMEAGRHEIITLFYGEDITAARAESLAETISRKYPDQDVESVDGGQPHYQYIISAE